jgi:2',3'-cyclic-nucleotide 2'-phosphodiesterase (5'-nucleotidase family)
MPWLRITRRSFVALLFVLLPISAQDSLKSLTILHSNDLHAQLIPDDSNRGGFARLATVVRREKAHCIACLYLNAGDLVQGSPVSTIYRGLPIFEVANLLGIDAATLGNHEFDYSWKRTQQFVKTARYPVLSANVVDASGHSITGKAYIIRTVGGVRVAIIGELLEDLVTSSRVSASMVEPWRLLPVVETVKKYVAEVRDRADIIVVLGHIRDREEVQAVLQQVPEVSVVIAGHNHDRYKEMWNVDGRVAVLVDAFGVELGRLDLKVDVAAKKVRSAEWSRIPVDASVPPAPDVERAVARWEAKISKLVDVPIGEASEDMDKPALKALFERATLDETHADFAFFDQGSLRVPLKKGRILARHIWTILPYDNVVVIGKFKGSQLPAKVLHGRTVNPDQEYMLATSDFTATNQAASSQLGTTGLQFQPTGTVQRDQLIEWIKKKKVIP